MGALFSLLVLIFAILLPVHAEQTYESEREALTNEAFRNGSLNDEFLIIMLLNRHFLERDSCDMFDAMLDGKEYDCDREQTYRIPGLSKKGGETLISAAKTYEAYQSDLRDEEARLFVAFCETGITDPGAIARKKADIRESMFELELQFYEQVIGELDESDVIYLERYNSEKYGRARPGMNDARNQIEKTLAERFPQEYRQEHLMHCVTAAENKGMPFRQFRRKLSGCEGTTLASGENGKIFKSSCMMIEYWAQKPEKPGDEELTYE